MDKLKPCPFCGAEPIIIREYDMTKVKCDNFECWILPATSYYTNEENAFEAWNERASDGTS
jgi:hypothetical protein